MLTFRASLWFFSVVAVCACSKPETATPPADPETKNVKQATTEREIDPCSLLTAEEVAEIVGEPTKETKRLDERNGGLAVAQCFYEATTFVNSFHLLIVQGASGAEARDPRQVWNETFAPDKLKEAGLRAPEAVADIGDAAFWRSQRNGAALYVLNDNIYLRVAVEGADDKETKVKRCTEIARKALSRLSRR